MITLHRLNGQAVVVNAELIEFMDRNADTVISMATGNRILVRESVEDVVALVLEYRRKIGGSSTLPELLKRGGEGG